MRATTPHVRQYAAFLRFRPRVDMHIDLLEPYRGLALAEALVVAAGGQLRPQWSEPDCDMTTDAWLVLSRYGFSGHL